MEIVTEHELENRFGALPWAEPRAVVSGNFVTPRRLVGLFDAAVESYRIFVLNAQDGIPTRRGVIPETPFVGPAMRDLPNLDYLPVRLSLVPRLFEIARPPDLVLLHTSVVCDGKVSLGAEVNILPAAIERARARGGLVVAQLNRHMPYTYGDGELDVEVVDLGIEVDEELTSRVRIPSNDVTAAVGVNVAALVGDGATIQVGIGEIPDAVLRALIGLRGMGVWSEVISDGILELEHGGVFDEERSIITTFLFGTPELYSWVDRNPRVRVLRTETVNNPGTIASHPQMCSLNTALQVDLWAQANASFVRGRIYSGFGGQPDFVVGALHSDGGQAIVALPSWHRKSDTSIYRAPARGACDLVPALGGRDGAGACSSVRTEPTGASALSLIEEAAHPDARPGLWESLDGPTSGR